MTKTAGTRFLFYPFDLFGGQGAGAGAELLADAVREMIADNKREKTPTRARAYDGRLKIREYPFLTMDDYSKWRKRAGKIIRRVLAKTEFMFWITGNHLGSLPLYDELAKGKDKWLIVQFDAHLDIHNFSDCTSEPTHGNFLLHCEQPLPKVVNVGHRELLLPAEHIAQYYQHSISADQLACDTEAAVRDLRRLSHKSAKVLIDLDCDVFDSAYFPGVAVSQPFGLSPPTLLRLIDAVWSDRVAGVAISEFLPARDQQDKSLETLMWLIEYLLLKRYES